LAGGVLRVDRLLDLAVGPDHVGVARGVAVLGCLCRAVRESGFALGIRKEAERVAELVREGLVLRDLVEGDPEDLDALGLVFADSITEPAALLGSAGGVRLGVEPKDDAFAGEVAQAHGLAVLILAVEFGRLVTDLQHRGMALDREELEDLADAALEDRALQAMAMIRITAITTSRMIVN
jgi:hypothetical protein